MSSIYLHVFVQIYAHWFGKIVFLNKLTNKMKTQLQTVWYIPVTELVKISLIEYQYKVFSLFYNEMGWVCENFAIKKTYFFFKYEIEAEKIIKIEPQSSQFYMVSLSVYIIIIILVSSSKKKKSCAYSLAYKFLSIKPSKFSSQQLNN